MQPLLGLAIEKHVEEMTSGPAGCMSQTKISRSPTAWSCVMDCWDVIELEFRMIFGKSRRSSGDWIGPIFRNKTFVNDKHMEPQQHIIQIHQISDSRLLTCL